MLFGAAVCLVIGIVLLLCYRNSRKENFFFRRAPQLKISELHSFDDAWITGIIETTKILVSPFFCYESVFYEYKLYKKKVKFKKDKNGQSRRTEEWDPFYSQAESTPFLINDGSGKVAIDPTQAMKYSLRSDSHQTQSWKHTIRYFPASGPISAVGVTSENRDKLIKKGEIPLMITTYGRRQFMQDIQKNERRLKYIGFALIWLSFNFGFMKLAENIGTYQQSHINMVLLGSILSSIPFGIFYYYFTYNSFVNLRRKVVNSWANIDVDLKNRYELIPSFISLIETYMSHEKNTLISIATIRENMSSDKSFSSRMKSENEISRQLANIQISVESSPHIDQSQVNLASAKLKIIEQKIASARSYYNDIVQEYNSLCLEFPSKIIAKIQRFEVAPFYGEQNGPSSEPDSLGKTHPRNPDKNSLSSLPPNIAAAIAANSQDSEEKSA